MKKIVLQNQHLNNLKMTIINSYKNKKRANSPKNNLNYKNKLKNLNNKFLLKMILQTIKKIIKII